MGPKITINIPMALEDGVGDGTPCTVGGSDAGGRARVVMHLPTGPVEMTPNAARRLAKALMRAALVDVDRTPPGLYRPAQVKSPYR